MNDKIEWKVTVEHMLDGDLGFRLHWTVAPHFAEVTVYEVVVGVEEDRKVHWYIREGWQSLPEDMTSVPEEAEKYLTGSVKWDGCSDFNIGCILHFCGPHGYRQHIKLLEHIYRRAFELMKREPEEPWEDE